MRAAGGEVPSRMWALAVNESEGVVDADRAEALACAVQRVVAAFAPPMGSADLVDDAGASG